MSSIALALAEFVPMLTMTDCRRSNQGSQAQGRRCGGDRSVRCDIEGRGEYHSLFGGEGRAGGASSGARGGRLRLPMRLLPTRA